MFSYYLFLPLCVGVTLKGSKIFLTQISHVLLKFPSVLSHWIWHVPFLVAVHCSAWAKGFSKLSEKQCFVFSQFVPTNGKFGIRIPDKVLCMTVCPLFPLKTWYEYSNYSARLKNIFEKINAIMSKKGGGQILPFILATHFSTEINYYCFFVLHGSWPYFKRKQQRHASYKYTRNTCPISSTKVTFDTLQYKLWQ